MTLGEYIKAYRDMHGMSQREIANLTGLSNTYISNLEKGVNSNGSVTTPSFETYQAIAKATGCTARDLIDLLDDVTDEMPAFSSEEQQMILQFRKASSRDKRLILDILSEYK